MLKEGRRVHILKSDIYSKPIPVYSIMTQNKDLPNKEKPYRYECTGVEFDPFILLSKFGMFQIRSLVILSFIFANLGGGILISVFVNIIPEHECQINQVSESVTVQGL